MTTVTLMYQTRSNVHVANAGFRKLPSLEASAFRLKWNDDIRLRSNQ